MGTAEGFELNALYAITSGAVERLFSLVQNTQHKSQAATLESGIETKCIVGYNNRLDLEEDLLGDEEAVAVWSLAVDLKAKKAEADCWVRGWRMRVVKRQSCGGGYDLYMRAPDMHPEDMANRHATSSTTIRSFVKLREKLRERMKSGASSGLATPLVAAVVYYAPSEARVRLDLQVVAAPRDVPMTANHEPASSMDAA